MSQAAISLLASLSLIWLELSSAAQTIQPIYSFTNGPIYPYAGLALGTDGNYYGTTQQGGSGNYGTVFRVTTNGTVTMLASFANTNGSNPQATLVLGPDGNFYGTTYNGGTAGKGVVFRITTNGTLTMLHAFSGSTSVSSTNTDGAYPRYSGLTVGPDGDLYGTTEGGGTNGYGTVFQITTNGVFTTPANFSFPGPSYPFGGLTLGPDGSFYGTTTVGGSSDDGTVFSITTNGTLTTVASFGGYLTGSDPYAGLTLGPDGNFYGTTYSGGYANSGTIFRVSTNGVLTSLYAFSATVNRVNADGANPEAGLALGPDGNFYGTTYVGGTNGWGTVFQITTNGTLTILTSFNTTTGVTPVAGLTLGPDGNFYGTTEQAGGSYYNVASYGTVFQITTNGTLTTLASFTNSSGLNPYAGLTLGPDGSLYGTTVNGGISGNGTVFRITTNGSLTTIATFTNTVLNGANPYAALTLGPDGGLYGTTRNGGSNGYGAVFRITTNGLLTELAGFRGTNGANPYAPLTLGFDGNFYGTTFAGGGTNGTVFRITTNGTLITLAKFTGTNGASPYAGLTLGPDGNFYGTTYYGGSNGSGTVFQITTNGTLTTLYSFTAAMLPVTNGAYPAASLTFGPDGNLYGTTEGSAGNVYNGGTVFRITTAGTLTTLANFSSYPANLTNLNPYAGLTLGADGNFYGTTVDGRNYGSVFRITTNRTVTTLATFANINGATPYAGLTLGPDGNFYGTTENGGPGGGGVIYRLNLAPSITAQPASEIVPIGGTANFAVGATGTPPLAYQWYFNTNTSLSGATNPVLSFGPVLTNEAGNYDVIVTSPYGSATSDLATLTVLLQPNCYGISNNGDGTVTLLLASTPARTNTLWTTTNLSQPLAQWQPISTNTADPTGLFQFTDTNTAATRGRFYILSSP